MCIGKQSLGYVFGATVKKNVDGVPKVYIARNNGFLSVGDFEGAINVSIKFESKKKELELGEMYSTASNIIR